MNDSRKMDIKKYWWAGVAFVGLSAWSVGQGLEVYGQWPACRLCHIERWTFLAMGGLALLHILLKNAGSPKSWTNFFSHSVVLTSLFGAGMAAYHTAIQFHWIALPSFCRLPDADTLDQFMALPTATCDQWTMSFLFLPVPLYLFFLWSVIACLTWCFFKKDSALEARKQRPYF